MYQNLKLKKIDESLLKKKMNSHHGFSKTFATFDQHCPYLNFYCFFPWRRSDTNENRLKIISPVAKK